MGYVIPHIYILTGDKRYLKDFHKQQRRDVIEIAVTGVLCFSILIGGFIYCLVSIGG